MTQISGAFTYQWRVDGVEIPGATGSTYLPVSADVGHSVDCVVTATNRAGSTSVIAGGGTITSNVSPPVNLSIPTISGTAIAGQTLTKSAGVWDDAMGTITQQWLSDGEPIEGETGTSLLIGSDEEGTIITVRETNTNFGGSTTATSDPTSTVTSPTEVMVRFDGTADWLTRDTGFTGLADGRFGIVSLWISMNGGDNTTQTIFRSSNGACELRRLDTNVIRVILKADGGSPSFQADTFTQFLGSAGVYHVLVAWDMNRIGGHGTQQVQCVINGANVGVNVVDSNETATDVDYTSADWSVGAQPGGGTKLNADLGPLYVNLTETMDITLPENIHKFFDSVGKPAWLGTDGSEPTGSPATLVLHGGAASYHTNIGTGGGMTVHGSLADSPVEPQVILEPLLANIYVDPTLGNNTTGDGSELLPWQTLTKAALYADEGATIWMIADGVFNEGIVLRRSATLRPYGVGAAPLMTGVRELKTATWTDESAIGPNLWSVLVTRPAGASASQRTMIWRDDVRGNDPKTTAASCTTDGDFFFATGGGPQKLYIYNSGGDPAADGSLTSIEVQNLQTGIQASNLTTLTVTGIEIHKFYTGISCVGTDVSDFSDLVFEGQVYNTIRLLGPATSSTTTDCTFRHNGCHLPGGSTEGSGMCWFLGAVTPAGTVSPDETIIDNCTVETHDGEDVIGQGYYGGGVITIIGGTFNCTNGENCIDVKSGEVNATGAIFNASSTAGGGNECVVCHNLVTSFVFTDCTFHIIDIDSSCVTFGDDTVGSFTRCLFRHDQNSSTAGLRCFNGNFQSGDGHVIDSCLFIGPIRGTGISQSNATCCIRLDSGEGHQILNNTIYMRSTTSLGMNVRAGPTITPHTVKNNIFATVGSAANNGYPIGTVAMSPTQLAINLDYNHYYRSDSSTRVLVQDWTNLVGYDATTISTKDANATTGNPLFTNPASFDFTLAVGSPAKNVGDPGQDGKQYRDSLDVRGVGNRNKGSEVSA